MSATKLPIVVSHEFPGSEFDGDTIEFLLAMEAYQRRYRRRYPAWSEVLYVLRLLGYTKTVPAAEIPTPKPEIVEAA